jgi:hypothetical protein
MRTKDYLVMIHNDLKELDLKVDKMDKDVTVNTSMTRRIDTYARDCGTRIEKLEKWKENLEGKYQQKSESASKFNTKMALYIAGATGLIALIALVVSKL